MTLAELRTRLIEIQGLDLTDVEANDLINEAYRKLCTDSEWTRARIDLGPGVRDQTAYDEPAGLHRILKLSVDGVPYAPSSDEEIQRIKRGDLRYRGTGFWWITFDDTGSEKVAVYPSPMGGEEIIAYCVVYPEPLTDDSDEPVTPPNYDRAILNYVQGSVFGESEDEIQARDYYMGEFARLTAELQGLRNSRGARKPIQMKVRGVTA